MNNDEILFFFPNLIRILPYLYLILLVILIIIGFKNTLIIYYEYQK